MTTQFAAELPTQEQNSALHEGARQASETLFNLLEAGGVAAASNYCNAVLSDTQSNYSPTERYAVTTLLGNEQRVANMNRTLEAGKNMITSLSAGNRQAQAQLEPLNARLRANTQHVEDSGYRTQRMLHNDDGNVSRVRHAGEEFSEDIQAAHNVSTQITDGLENWSYLQRQHGQVYADTYRSGRQHDYAIDAALKTTDPNYNDPPKDLSPLIDDVVVTDTCQKLTDLLASVSSREEAHEVIEQAICIEPNLQRQSQLADSLQNFAETTVTEDAIVVADLQDATNASVMFKNQTLQMALDEVAFNRHALPAEMLQQPVTHAVERVHAVALIAGEQVPMLIAHQEQLAMQLANELATV